jgi:hypothetical protein
VGLIYTRRAGQVVLLGSHIHDWSSVDMNERKKLSDILRGSDRDALAKQWKNTEAAKDLEPLPSGEYLFRVLSGEPFNAKSGTAGYKLTLEVVEGEQEGRRAWHDIWFTPAALPMAKRDLAKIGIQADSWGELEKELERPVPSGILIRARIALRKNDDGAEYNRIVRFEPAGIEPGDAFEPPPEADTSTPAPKPDPKPRTGDASELAPQADANGECEPPTFGSDVPAHNGIAPGPYDRGERR